MAKSVKGTQTEKNLLTSFAGESQARMRYTYFASVAKKEGYEHYPGKSSGSCCRRTRRMVIGLS